MLTRFFRDRRGSVLPIFAIALVPLIVATGGVVDYSRAFDQSTVVQDSMDGAALAAGKKLGIWTDTQIKAEAVAFYDTNVATKVDIIPTIVPVISGPTLTLTTTLHVPTYFLGMIGLNEFVFNLKAQTTQAMGTLEVAMALDNSGSMAGTKISTLIDAASNLTDTLFNLGATSTKPNPIMVGLVPFASSVKVDPANKTAAWMDQTGVAPYNAESFEGATGSPPVSNNTPSGTNVLNMFDTLTGTGSAWAGCVEERQAPYDVQDDPASTATPATMFVPMFAPDEPDNWTCTTGSCSKTCDSDVDGSSCSSGSAGLRYNGAPSGNQSYNNYLPDAGVAGTCGTLTMTKAAPAVFTSTAHGLTAGTPIAFETTGTLYTGLTPLSSGGQYYVSPAGLTANTFDVTAASTGTNFTISGTPVTVTVANPAVFTSTSHGLAIGNQISFATTGALPTGLTAGTAYYVKQVPTANTFTVSATSANVAISSITKASPGVVTTSAVHGLAVGNPIVFQTTGALPSPLVVGTTYYVKTVTSTTKFTVSTTSGGTAINTTTAGSGTHTYASLVTTTGSQSGTHTFFKAGTPSVVSATSHGLAVGDPIALATTGSLPSPLTTTTVYYVVTVPSSNTFTISTTSGGAGITISGGQSGTHSFKELVTTTGSQSGVHRFTEVADWTCANGAAGCAAGSKGQSEQIALLGQNTPQNLCKYGTVANKATISQINVGTNGGTYAGGPNFNCTTDKVLPLSGTKATVKTAISNMAADGTTNITAGLMWGWRLLSPTEPFTEGRAYSVGDNKKILILMTDGENTYFANGKFTVSHYGAWGYIWKSHLGTTSSTESVMTGKMEGRMETACANIRAANITIYTVAFEITDATTKQLLKDCASDPDTMAFDASDPSELTAAFTAIGDQISLLRLAQ